MSLPDEQQLFFGDPLAPLFGVLHRPVRVPNCESFGIVVCSPIAHEHGFSHRMLVEWARVLSRIGAWVLRFDYRGHGDSAGAYEQCTVEDFLEDALIAVAELDRHSGVQCRGFCGLRFGATIAALAATRDNRDPFLLLWEPIVRGDGYLDDLFRISMAKELRSSGRPSKTRQDLRNALIRGGEVSIEGHILTNDLYRSLASINLLESCQDSRGPALIVQISTGRPRPIKADLEALCSIYSEAGESEVRSVCTPPLWYGSLTREYNARVQPASLFNETIQWVRAQVGHAAYDHQLSANPCCSATSHAIRSPSAPTSATGSARTCARASCHSHTELNEKPIRFTVDGTVLAGILHLPASGAAHRPVVILLPQGMNRRTGWNRLYVKLARALVDGGFAALRFDGRGLGDSGAQLDMATGADLFLAIERGLHMGDTSGAIDFALQTLGPRPVVLAGVCGGAVTASLVAADDERVAGAALLETSLMYTTRTQVAQPMWRYRDRVRSLKAWMRLLSLQIDFRQHFRSLSTALVRRLGVHTARTETQRFIGKLGPAVNLEFISSFKRCLERRMPILFVFGSTDNEQCFAQVRPLLLGSSTDAEKWVSHHVVQGADHDFLEAEHARELTNELSAWLADPGQPWADARMEEDFERTAHQSMHACRNDSRS